MTLATTLTGYADRGWSAVPLPPRAKTPPPAGFTGRHGVNPTPDDIAHWARTYPEDANVALRVPADVIGLDVDAYADKPGAASLAALVAELGPLPDTWTSTSRGSETAPGDSRIMFYRVPAAAVGNRFRALPGEGIETVQFHHRYAVVYPSVHPDGRVYRWHAPDGHRTDAVPGVDELAELPAAWAAWLVDTANRDTPDATTPEHGTALLAALSATDTSGCVDVVSFVHTAAARMAATGVGGRHDTMTALCYRLVASAAAGHPGYPAARDFLAATWEHATAGEGREREFAVMLDTAARKVAADWPDGPASADPCRMVVGRSLVEAAEPYDPAQHDTTDRGQALGIHAHLRGTAQFLTDADQFIARGAAGDWHRMGLSAEAGARVLVNRVLNNTLRGDPTAEPGTIERRRAEAHRRLSSSVGSGAVATMMASVARDVDYPNATTMSRLDADPFIVWAGGHAYDLRASIGRLVRADLDPATPHLKSAPYTPRLGDAPRWDAFMAAMIPDPAHREWIMHLMGAALVGVPARMLLVAYGPPGIGKTQLFTLLSDVMGDDERGYATAADRRLLGDENHHASVLMQLAGRRFAWVDEGPRSGRASIERLKALTGGGQMTANLMRANPVTFRPTHTLALTTNDEPELADDALRSRVRYMALDGDADAVKAARHAIGDVSGPVWQAEAPVVLGRLILYAARWLSDPTTTDNPVDVAMTLEDVARGQDIVRLWVTEECAPTGWTSTSSLYAAFREYATSQGIPAHRIPTANRFGRDLTRLGVEPRRTTTARGWVLSLRRFGGGSWTPSGPVPTGVETGDDGTVSGPVTQPTAANLAENASYERVSAKCDTFDPNDGTVTEPPTGDQAIRHGLDNGFGVFDDGMTDVDPIRPTKTPKRNTNTVKTPLQHHIGGKNREVPSCVNRGIETTPADPPAERVVDRLNRRRAAAGHAPVGGIQPALVDGPPRLGLPATKRRGDTPTPTTVADATARLESLPVVTVDVEHTGYPIGHRLFRLKTIQLGDADTAVVLDTTDPAQVDLARTTLDNAAAIIAHWGAADLVPIAAACGVDPEPWWAKFTDTAVLTGLTNPGDRPTNGKGESVLGLKELAAALVTDPQTTATDAARAALFKSRKWLTNTRPDTAVERNGWAQVDPTDPVMVDYAAADVLDTAALATRLLPSVPDAPGLLDRERATQRITNRVASRGLRLDPERVAALTEQARADMAAAAEPMRAFGITDPGSTAQLADAFTRMGADLPRTPKTGKVSTAKAAIERLSYGTGDASDLARLLLEWRKPETLLTSFMNPYTDQIEHGDGRIRPVIQTLGADATGRMSSVRPNIQQVPRAGGVRECVLADDGHVFVAADFSSVEVRIAAWVSGDEHLAAMVRDGVDMHAVIARMVWGDQFTKDQRYGAKRAVFGRWYGAGMEAIARQLGQYADHAAAVIAALDAAAPGLSRWSAQLRDAVRLGAATYWTHRSGRRTWFTRDAPHKAVNYAIQSTGRELLVDALLAFEDRMPGCTVVPIHDELVMMVPENRADEATQVLTECMTMALTMPDGTPLPIECETDTPSHRWTSAT